MGEHASNNSSGAGQQHIVCFSFDFDALSLPIARLHNSPTKLSQGEFGVLGAQRILALLQKHSVPATWFVPGHTIETFPRVCHEISSASAGHEVGNHGWSKWLHPYSLVHLSEFF